MKRDAETQDKELFRENEDLKIERAKLKAEIDSMLFEIQSIVDAKLGLELEIAAYRKLLEVEEKRPTWVAGLVAMCGVLAILSFGIFYSIIVAV